MKKILRRALCLLCILALSVTGVSALSVEEALGLLDAYYVDDLPAAAYEAQSLDELFEVLGDPYTYYMTPKAYEQFSTSVESETNITGVGVVVQYTADGFHVVNLVEGGGAKRAGVVSGDTVIAVDGVSCTPATDEMRERILGPENSTVVLTIRHSDGSEEDFTIERKTIEIHNTNVTEENGVVTIDCDSFGSQTGEYFQEGVAAHPDAKHWVVDLRDNGGGYTTSAVTALGVFTGAGQLLYFRDRNDFVSYSASSDDALTDKPAIVLINAYSASSSELFAGDIRGSGAGIVIGPRSYGKGTAQVILDKKSFPNLFTDDSLKVTTQRFYCLDGNTTDKIGVVPTLYIGDMSIDAVAHLLDTEKPEKGDYLTFSLSGWTFYVSLETARSEQYAAAFAELLAALPPDVSVTCEKDGDRYVLDSSLTAQLYELDVPFRFFNDIAFSSYRGEINTLAAYGMLVGDGNGSFRPGASLTRAELCSLLSQAINVTSPVEGLYDDVPAGKWFTGPISAMTLMGLVNGVGDGRFDPSGTLTQEQLITVMGRFCDYLNLYAHSFAGSLSADDLAGDARYKRFSPWARSGAAILTELAEDASGSPINMCWAELEKVAPQGVATREQAAAVLCRILKTTHVITY